VKVYVVTSGCYSDYSIEKIFTDKQKAEEYKEWLIDANDVEEYETEDDMAFNKYYKICVTYNSRHKEPNVRFEKCLEANVYNHGISYLWYDWSKCFELALVRFVPAQNWNEEFYVNKYTNAMYDYIAIAKQKRLEGWSEKDIQRLFNSHEEEVQYILPSLLTY